MFVLPSLLATLSFGAAPAVEAPSAEREFRVLLAAEPGTERAKDWEGFLRKRLGPVETIAVEDLTGERMRPFDLVLLDRDDFVMRNIDAGGSIGSKPPEVPLEEWRTPTILVGAIGGTTADRLGLKIGWRFG